MKKQISVLLLGYSGQRNFGDDLLLKQAYDYLDQVNIKMTVHTSNCGSGSDYLQKWFPKVEIVKNINIPLSLVKKHTHVLYFGGGVFFDYKQINTKEYIRKYFSLIKLFAVPKLFFFVKFAGIGIGLGPFVTKRGENLCRFRLKYFDYLNVRDLFSKNKCKEWGIGNVSLSPDLSFAFSSHLKISSEKSALKHHRKNILICPRDYPHGKNKNTYLKNLLSVTSELISHGYKITVFAFQGNHDEKVMESFKSPEVKLSIWNPDSMTLFDVFNLFFESDCVITARMHGIFVAGMVNTPSIGIGLHPKLAYASGFFHRSVTMNDIFTLDEFRTYFRKIDGLEINKNEIEEPANECRNQYLKIIKWLKKD